MDVVGKIGRLMNNPRTFREKVPPALAGLASDHARRDNPLWLHSQRVDSGGASVIRFSMRIVGVLASTCALGTVASGQVPGVEHVVVVGIDGLSPDGIAKAKTPNFARLVKQGASTMHARGVMPTVSSPNWASMIMGAGPEQHGVTNNDWTPEKATIKPTVKGSGAMFPTIFGLVREQRPSAKIAVFHDWDGFGRLFERNAVDVINHPKGPDATTEQAIAYLKEQKPLLTFIHLDHVDHAGHEKGHGTADYYQSVEEADRLIGLILLGLDSAGIAGSTAVLVTSDHGGVGKGHGGNSMAELEIPWILSGPGVAPGKEITSPVNTYDTAATVAFLLGIKPPNAWIARPVRDAFVKTD
jgi:arylsulfatase A-like enzyme